MKRRSLIGIACAAAFAFNAGPAAAQGYPSQPIRIVVPYPAGGIVDLMARSVQEGLSRELGQPVIIENKPGASASIGTDLVAKAAPDGHTLLMATLALAVNPNLIKVPWDPARDFAGVAHMGVVANIAAVNPSLPVKSMKELVEYARANPGKLNYVNSGNGSSPHVSAELLQQVHDIKLAPIMYKGIPPAIPDFLSGTVPFGFFPFSTIAPHIRAGKARPIAIASPVRHKQFPEIPTMGEQGFESSQVNSWYAFAVPKKTPKAIVERLNAALNKVLAEPATIEKAEKGGMSVIAGWSAEKTDRMFADEVARWADVIRKAGISAQ